MRRIDPLVAAAIWLMFFGVWPLADPGHAGDTPASMLDIGLHASAVLFFVLRAWVRWKDPEHKTNRLRKVRRSER